MNVIVSVETISIVDEASKMTTKESTTEMKEEGSSLSLISHIGVEDWVEQCLNHFYYESNDLDSYMKCSFRRSDEDPHKFTLEADTFDASGKKKRHKILENCFDHCDCLHQLVELRRQKCAEAAFHQVSMQYGGDGSFQRPNLEKHVKNVRARKSITSLIPRSLSSLSSSKLSKPSSVKKPSSPSSK